MSDIIKEKERLKGQKLRVISLFSSYGGMDLGFTGGFKCLKKSINKKIHNDWISSENENWVELKRTEFDCNL